MTATETADAGGVTPSPGAALARSPSAPPAGPSPILLATSFAGLLWTLGGCALAPTPSAPSHAFDTSSEAPPATPPVARSLGRSSRGPAVAPEAPVGPRAPRFLEPIERLYPSGDVVPEARVAPVDLDALAERLLRRSPLDRHDPLARHSPIDPAAPLHRSNPATPPDPRDRVGRR